PGHAQLEVGGVAELHGWPPVAGSLTPGLSEARELRRGVLGYAPGTPIQRSTVRLRRKPMKTWLSLVVALAVVLTVGVAAAQQPAPPAPTPYGTPINLEQAKKVMAGAEAEAKKNNWPVAIVILDSGGQMVMMQRLDNTQWGSVDIAKEKARTAVALRRPTKVLQDGIAQGGVNLRFLSTGFSVL